MSYRNLNDLVTSVSTTLDAVSVALGLDHRLLRNVSKGYQGMPSDLLAGVASVLQVDISEVIFACPRVIMNPVDGWHNPQQLPFDPTSVSPVGGIYPLGFEQGPILTSKGEAPPTVVSISPSSGNALGGIAVTIGGTNFGDVLAVIIGGVTCLPPITVANTMAIVCDTPATSVGVQDVSVTTTGGTATKTGAYTAT